MDKEYKILTWLLTIFLTTMAVAVIVSLNPKFKQIAMILVVVANVFWVGLSSYLIYFAFIYFSKITNKINYSNTSTNFEHTHTHSHYHYNETKLREGAEQIESRPDGTTITTRYARRWD